MQATQIVDPPTPFSPTPLIVSFLQQVEGTPKASEPLMTHTIEMLRAELIRRQRAA